jgi:endonuclease/exonuclease/phosphatase family metal-dependent hydrolase
LLIAYKAPLISPEEFWLPAFWGLAYPYLLLINIIFVVYWMLRRRWSFLIPLIAIAIGYKQVQDFIQLTTNKNQSFKNSGIKITSYNVRAFDKFEWSKDKSTPTKMLEFLKQNQADIFCFQEFHHTKNGILSISNLKKVTGCKYVFIGSKTNGVAVFSKFPIVKSGEIKFDKGNWCNAIYADINKNNRVFRIYNLHLESNRLGGRNYAFINKSEFKADEQELQEIKDISFRLRHAFIRRAKQAEIIRGHIEKSKFPTIICGDFNDTAHSYTYHKIKGDLIDCFSEQGIGISTTYSGDFPSFRIDFILHDNKTVCSKYQRIKKKYSDHFPISTELHFIDE